MPERVKSSPAMGKYPSPLGHLGVQLAVAKANYHQIRRQKELARKTRQQEKQQKRAVAKAAEPDVADPNAVTAEGPTTDPQGSSGGSIGS